MGFTNPAIPWRALERLLSGHPTDPRRAAEPPSRPPARRPETVVPYAELHCHSSYSFLDGVSDPEDLVEEAVRLGIEALAITDHDGFPGAARLAGAARGTGLRTVYGSELSLDLHEAGPGVPDPGGRHLLVLARGAEGYRRLAGAVTAAHLRDAGNNLKTEGEKGKPTYRLEELAASGRGEWLVLTGCRKGAVRAALAEEGADGAARELDRLIALFGRDNVAVELIDHSQPVDSTVNDVLADLAERFRLPVVATNNVHYATPAQGRLAATVAAIRARLPLEEMDGWLPAAPMAYLRSGAEMARRFARHPGAVGTAAALGRECAFDLKLVAPELPPYPVPLGHNEDSYLRELVHLGATTAYGTFTEAPHAHAQLERELAVISAKDLAGYFLVVHRVVEFCRREDIFCQGRGSAANSAVCYALGVTKVDPVRWELLFERFLSTARDGPPDIDLDIESDRREEVIQHVYGTYGREHAAQVANVITYRARSAIRDVAKALGHSPGQADAWSKKADRFAPSAGEADEEIPDLVRELAAELQGRPRHLGIHSGGMILTGTPIGEVCPVEWARMPGRTVVQWDKDDCAAMDLVKFDLLGLGMLSALHYAVDLIAEHHGVEVDLARLDLADPEVYDMLCRADTIGVFQVESRAQMATLPRLRPREFHDLVVEVALIRPGPIQGGSVHPYLRRRRGEEDPDPLHESMRGALRRTYGVPLFQEQLMQVAIDVAGFTATEADELRQAIGSKRSYARVEAMRARFQEGAAARHGIGTKLANRIYAQIVAFAGYGFPESHSISFAHLVYASAWIKHYYPAAFCAALLRAQPMGFYSPQSLVADARRHGVVARRPEINASLAHATLEPLGPDDPTPAVRLGLASVRTIGQDLAEAVVAERAAHGPFTDMVDLAERVRLSTAQVEALATGGAFACFGIGRREALWAAGVVAARRPSHLPGTTVGTAAPQALPGMTEFEETVSDVWATGVSPGRYPVEFVRAHLDRLGALPAAKLSTVDNGTRVLVGGAVTHRQRPQTAGGVVFLNVEDETGMANVVCTKGIIARYRKAMTARALLVRGVVQQVDGAATLTADRLQPLALAGLGESRDYR
ncbi:error-prone DNA polymerase [Allokutzneria sp. A3M-2-11 16]|uniref:error-prone DNA polymerase n=1 Tax=Allokutzneria sp. A3M-2-11 16 TaxID=2962043 RepID=UPI0020B70331|nr:error-prone DNA polymerase [Allokutzneria sp. A3M-2-11 16]MCP3803203.1 error-prone DNA polymerase [Allokutzneria sp. A3M-2-11 16]